MEAIATAGRCSDDGWTEFAFDGLPIGRWAKDITVNNYVVADYRLVPDYPVLGRAQVANLLLLRTAYERAFDHFRPDRVVTNDSYYGMWALLQHLARRRGIPFYSHWGGVRRGGWCYAMDDAAMNLDFSKPWPEFSRGPLTSDEAASVEKWLQERCGGGDLLLDTASASADGAYPEALARLDPTLPTALLAANVVWDLAALDKQVVFTDMIDWVAKTIEWFASHPQYQLIVKPHPGELHPSIPESREQVGSALEARGITVPPNVVVLPPRLRLTVYDLFAKVRVGLLHTSTVGIEMAAQDLTVITTGRAPYRGFGFTVDPSTPGEYFHVLEQAMSGERWVDSAIQRDLSWKFLRFYQFHYSIRFGLFDYSWGVDPTIQVESAMELLPGHNPLLDYVAGSILQGLPIIAENRWPSAS